MSTNGHERGMAGVVAELKEESKQFVSTRLAMLVAEMREKIAAWRTASLLMAAAVTLLATAWLLLTSAFVALIYVAFQGNTYALFLAFLIVFGVYAIFGGLALYSAMREWKEAGVVPQRTLSVLKDDEVWIAHEAQVHL